MNDKRVEGLIAFAEAFGVEDKLIAFIQDNPNGPFWKYLDVFPDGLAPGDDGEGILADD